MEVIMGRHPGDLIQEGQSIFLVDVIGQRIPPPKGLAVESVALVAAIAMACLQAKPPQRPTMRQVSLALTNAQWPAMPKPFSSIKLDDLVAAPARIFL